MDDAHIVETADPEEAFAVLADESRIDILRALWEADGQSATFSELREAVGMRDSGKFNYHLGKLTDRFVRKTDDGYDLRAAGRHMIGSLLSGAYTMDGEIESIELDDPCPLCGDSLAFTYTDDRARVACRTGSFEAAFPIPPGAFAGASTEAYPVVADRYLRTLLSQARNEFCSACEGPVQVQLETKSVAELPQGDDFLVMVAYECDRCESTTQLNLSTLLLDHPAIVSFHYEHDIDVRAIKFWELGAATDEPKSKLTTDETHAAEVTYAIGDERLTVHVDDTLSVVSIDRGPRKCARE